MNYRECLKQVNALIIWKDRRFTGKFKDERRRN